MAVAIGLLIARAILGFSLFAHGAQKLFGWFGGSGLKNTGGFFESLGFRPGPMFALMTGLGEALGGVLTLLGWLNPIGPALIIAVMLTAIGSVHITKGFWQSNGGYELNLTNIAVALAIASAGPGAISIDAVAPVPLLGNPTTAWILVAVAVLGGLLSLAARHKPAQAATPA